MTQLTLAAQGHNWH